jgi:adenosylmethionine-8-amino-7-oxononanoate aminotransferase
MGAILARNPMEAAVSRQNEAKQLWLADKNHFIHPYTDFACFEREGSQVITRASGVEVIDSAGNTYLDAIAGLWCVNIGHGRTEMADAIRDQVLQMQYYNPFGHSSNEPAALLAEKLAALAPENLNHVFYSTGGSTANDVAARLAHYYFEIQGRPLKKKILSRLDAYHGSTYFAASLTGIEGTKIGFNSIATDIIEHLSAANCYRAPAGMDEASYCDHLVAEFEQKVAELGAENIACFFAEPIMGAGGVLVAPANYHARIQQLCRANEILYIADEVVTGFGRLGEWFVSDTLYQTRPDMIVAAKGISSGYIPLGATLISDEIYAAISKPQALGGALTMGFTYSGHAVACAAALKNIEIIERENLCQHVRDVGPSLLQHLQPLRELPTVGDVRGSHFMVGIELVANKQTQESFDATVGAAHRVFQRCRNRGVIVRPVGNVVVLSPPLIFTEAHCQRVAATLYDCINETAAELKVAGLIKKQAA